MVDPGAEDRRRAFEAVVAATYVPLQRYLRRRADPASADDVLGDVLLVMWRRAEDIPADAVLAWSYGVARGCLANSARTRQRHLRLVRRLAADRVWQPPGAAAEDPRLHDAMRARLSRIDPMRPGAADPLPSLTAAELTEHAMQTIETDLDSPQPDQHSRGRAGARRRSSVCNFRRRPCAACGETDHACPVAA